MNTNLRILFGEPIEPELHRAELPFDQADNVFNLSADQAFQIYILKSIKASVWEHVSTSSHLECSGILLGQPFQTANGKIKFILVVGAIGHNTSQRSVGHVTVGTNEIAAARIESEKKYPDLLPVGWYHSHPGHGIFLSAQDMVIVRSIYNLEWHVALVIDPIHKTSGMFRGSEGEKIGGWLELSDDYDWVGWAINSVKKNSNNQFTNGDNGELYSVDDTTSQGSEILNYQNFPNSNDATRQEEKLDHLVAERNLQEASKLLDKGDIATALRQLYTLRSKYPDYESEKVTNLFERISSISREIEKKSNNGNIMIYEDKSRDTRNPDV